MPKARRRTARPRANSRSVKGTTTQPRTTTSTRDAASPALSTGARNNSSRNAGAQSIAPASSLANRPIFSPVVRGPQSLVMPGMVALGCWLMAFTLFFLSTDPNRNLFGGMAMLIALLWSFSFGVRVRKLLSQRTVS